MNNKYLFSLNNLNYIVFIIVKCNVSLHENAGDQNNHRYSALYVDSLLWKNTTFYWQTNQYKQWGAMSSGMD